MSFVYTSYSPVQQKARQFFVKWWKPNQILHMVEGESLASRLQNILRFHLTNATCCEFFAISSYFEMVVVLVPVLVFVFVFRADRAQVCWAPRTAVPHHWSHPVFRFRADFHFTQCLVTSHVRSGYMHLLANQYPQSFPHSDFLFFPNPLLYIISSV